jgi:L-lactate dehydrogenase complex protein LldG
MSTREIFLQRVRQAVEEGNRVGDTALPSRDRVVGPTSLENLVGQLRQGLTAAGGQLHSVLDRESAAQWILELVMARAHRLVLIGRDPLLDTLTLPVRLAGGGISTVVIDSPGQQSARDAFFTADIGITGVEALIAETGTVVLRSQPGEPRSLSLLPPVHVAVAETSQLVPDLFDLYTRFPAEAPARGLPSCLSLITGPSKTGDIEMRLVTGVHGPGELHVVLVAS